MRYLQRFLPILCGVLCSSHVAWADRIAIQIHPAHLRVVESAMVITGEVVDVEEKLVSYPLQKENPKAAFDYQMVTVKIDRTLLGGKGLTQVRVGTTRLIHQIAFQKGQKGCFFLVPHHSGDFFTTPSISSPPYYEQQMLNYKAELELVERATAILQDPAKALAAKQIADQQLAVQVLLTRYNSRTHLGSGDAKQVEVPQEISSKIISILSEMPYFNQGTVTGLQNLFWMTQPEKNGFVQRADIGKPDLQEKIMKDFLKANQKKIKLQQWVEKQT
ncbi:MAG: hypothetical protein R3B84_23350 [Zavarzinella sp.]